MRLPAGGWFLAAVLLWGPGGRATAATPTALPYDRTCPVIYDNDGAIESGFTDTYLMALASARVIRLRGIITTCSWGEEQRQPPFSPLPTSEVVRERQELIAKARRSGLRNLPDVTAGPSLTLKRPASGRIEETVPYRTPGSRLILREARRATSHRPLVIVMGGQATCVVDATCRIPPSPTGWCWPGSWATSGRTIVSTRASNFGTDRGPTPTSPSSGCAWSRSPSRTMATTPTTGSRKLPSRAWANCRTPSFAAP